VYAVRIDGAADADRAGASRGPAYDLPADLGVYGIQSQQGA